jgi:hypothetical protein
MRKSIYAVLVSLVAVVIAALPFGGPAEAAARCDDHHQCHHKSARRARQRVRVAPQRSRARRRDRRPAVAYVCPMHPDIRERSRGTCPKCLMDLVAEPRGAKAGGPKTETRGAGASTAGGV